MTDIEIKERIMSGLNDFLTNENWLITQDLNERAITHCLAIYLLNYFKGFNIDCEYNGDIESPNRKKKIQVLKDLLIEHRLLSRRELVLEKEFIERAVYPDIIIHVRGTNSNNLCIIEVKKSTSRVNRAYDYLKLQAYTSANFGNTLNYQLGIFIEFIIEDYPSFDLSYFKDGKQINNV